MTKEVDEAHLRAITNKAIESVRRAIEETYREHVAESDEDEGFLTLRLDIDLNDGSIDEIDYW